MCAARFHTLSEPFAARLGVLIGLWAGLAVLLTVLPGHADPAEDVAAARQVISQQIEAFRQDDAPTAYSHAAPTVQAMFPTPAVFMEMVRRGYPAVYRATRYSFDPAKPHPGSGLLQPVRLEWNGGSPMIAIYLLDRQANGDWKIEGVVLSPDERIRV
jgi:hypothetical protein